MTPEQIKIQISELQKKHDAVGDELDQLYLAEQYEADAEELIIAYCEAKGYLVKGFPTEKRNLDEEEYDEEYFSTDRFRLYLDTLALQKPDVAELLHHYHSTFWPDFNENKEEFMSRLKHQLDHGGYDVEL